MFKASHKKKKTVHDAKSKCGLLLASPVGNMLFQSQLLRISSNVHLAGNCLKQILLCIVINFGWKQQKLVVKHSACKYIGLLFGSDMVPQKKDKTSMFKGKICPFPLINLYLFREMSLRGRDALNIFASIYLENQTRAISTRYKTPPPQLKGKR